MTAIPGRLSGGSRPSLDALVKRVEQLEAFKATVLASFFTVTHVAPAKPLQNMIRIADGTDWNPGSGAGIYIYVGSSWIPLQ